MALTCWCKKCCKDVAYGDTCPLCGGKLGKSTVRSAWCTDHTPAGDWMVWNGIMRIMLPVWLVLLLMIVGIELLIGGVSGTLLLLSTGLVETLLLILLLCAVAVLILLVLQGSDLLDCVVDQKGIHVQTYLPNPTKIKLFLRMKPMGLMDEYSESGQIPLVGQKEILWKDIRRITCWNEKTMVLFYSPHWWMRVALPCTPFTYEDVLSLCQDKLGKKKNVSLPPDVIGAKPAHENVQQLQMGFTDENAGKETQQYNEQG